MGQRPSFMDTIFHRPAGRLLDLNLQNARKPHILELRSE